MFGRRIRTRGRLMSSDRTDGVVRGAARSSTACATAQRPDTASRQPTRIDMVVNRRTGGFGLDLPERCCCGRTLIDDAAPTAVLSTRSDHASRGRALVSGAGEIYSASAYRATLAQFQLDKAPQRLKRIQLRPRSSTWIALAPCRPQTARGAAGEAPPRVPRCFVSPAITNCAYRSAAASPASVEIDGIARQRAAFRATTGYRCAKGSVYFQPI